MKKTYIIPEMEVEKMETMQMLAASVNDLDAVNEELNSSDEQFGRGFDFEEESFDW